MKRLASVLLALATLAPHAAPAQQRVLTISVYGFAQDAYKTLVYDPFEAKCACKVVVETGNSVERLAKMEARKADPVVDMAVVSMADALEAARKGLIDKIDVGKLSNYAKLYDIARDPNHDGMSVGYTFYATSIVYRADKAQIDSWADLLSPKLAGHVALPDIATNQGPPTLFMLGRALGSDTPNLAAAIDAVGAHKRDIVTFYVRASQVVQLMSQEEIWAAPVGRFAWAGFRKLDPPVRWAKLKEGETGGMNVMVLTHGGKTQDLALKFMDFWLSTEIQTALAQKLVDSPANREVKVAPDIAENLTYGEDTVKALKLIPSDVALANREAWLSRWNDKIGQ